MPKRSRRSPNTSETTSKRSKKQETKTEEAIVSHILDERGGKTKTKGRKTKRKQKHQYLCAWEDGSEPQWVDASHLKGQPCVDEWNEKEEEEPEIFDTKAELVKKCNTLSQWIQDAKRPVFLLGAGISAPVLPTFRGKNGLWTKKAYQNELADAKVSDGLQPTLAHRALVQLEKIGKVHFIATQNYDDLSVRSGFPDEKLSELHGNIFTETCEKCHRVYHRDFEVPLDDSIDHETGRCCEDELCRGVLKDNIIHFGEDLPWHALKMANAKFVGSDLTVVLGSSLQVTPASDLPFRSKRRLRSQSGLERPKAVIVNLQTTPRDEEADLLIRGTCNDVMDAVAKTLIGATWDQEEMD